MFLYLSIKFKVLSMNEKDLLIELYKKWRGEDVEKIAPLPISGSNRTYYRLSSQKGTAVGVVNDDLKENNAFLEFTKHFKEKGFSVPEIYIVSDDKTAYLQEDFGNETLYSRLTAERKDEFIPESVVNIYLKVVEELPRFQVLGHENFNYSNCYPRGAFDKQSMMWDLNYFKYYFLKLAHIPYDEQSLEDDFNHFAEYLSQIDSDFFLYRDFQSRNIMLKGDDIYFIDYQGGRRGALQYDLASLLYDAKADLSENIRELLLEKYLNALEKHIAIDRNKFKKDFYAFVLVRIMQAMGAYGYRGFYEKKTHFLMSIPYALENLKNLLSKDLIDIEIPTLKEVLKSLTVNERLMDIGKDYKGLTVRVNSFSFKKGLPTDDSGNGGGFIFDCRALPNPGRLEEYKTLTGMDKEVSDYLEEYEVVVQFKDSVKSLIDISVQNYIERNFTNLQINFGCTGGQHRSVYFAEVFSKYIEEKYAVKVILNHREQ